jgi:hypothetical protein
VQRDPNRLWEYAFENEMIINPTKSKPACFTKARMTEPLYNSLRKSAISEGAVVNTWIDQVNYAMK